MGMQDPTNRWLIYTDLDGTLLDHDSYSFAAALSALREARRQGIPVIPVTSKTLAELEQLYRQLDLDGPCIAENGALIAAPEAYFPALDDAPRWHRWRILHLGWTYAEIIEQLQLLRQQEGFEFLGFNDLGDAEVARMTGLSAAEAARARRRQSTEPLRWMGSDASLERFRQALDGQGLCLVRGGRFWHVMTAEDNKGTAIRRLNRLYRKRYAQAVHTIALGDSPNDLPMLAAADDAVVIRRKDGTCMGADELSAAGVEDAVCSSGIGPAGWNEAVLDLLARRRAALTSMNDTDLPGVQGGG